jgi:hypothetical protein
MHFGCLISHFEEINEVNNNFLYRKDMSVNAVTGLLVLIVKKLMHAYRILVRIMVFASIYRKDMMEIHINACVRMVSISLFSFIQNKTKKPL